MCPRAPDDRIRLSSGAARGRLQPTDASKLGPPISAFAFMSYALCSLPRTGLTAIEVISTKQSRASISSFTIDLKKPVAKELFHIAITPEPSIDPIFATSVGVAAAVVRINREEKEKGRSTEQSIESFKRRVNMVMEKSGEEGKVGVGGEKK
ncbi:hypothetical protein D0863_03870 [Hortaea werneckii]|uniref:Uncharacterized protein n=1 Tax=Hortaea werneckii TaxID=91943 RepID=A0A3M7E9W2_HORWE|nr:hypothetical protein D0863_03870 [Hortaea werneckii]